MDFPDGVEVEYTINRDDPSRILLNVYHFKIDESKRNQGLGTQVLQHITTYGLETEEIDVINVTMQQPPNEQEKIQQLFEKFDYDIIGPYEHRRYQNPVIEGKREV